MTDTPEMVERVARAIAENVSVGSRTEYGPGRRITVVGPVVVGVEEAARAAIEAMMEPTREMILAGETALEDFEDEDFSSNADGERSWYTSRRPGWERAVLQAMIKAALDQQS